MKGHQIKIKAP